MVRHFSAVAFAIVACMLVGVVTGAGAFVAGDGRGDPRNDCLIGLDGVAAGAVNGRTISCTDCDPTCDADGVPEPNGACSFAVQLCLNTPDLTGCEAAVLGKVTAKPKRIFARGVQVPALPADAAFVCGDATNAFVVKTRRKGRKAGRKKVKLLARTAEAPKRKDKDVLTFVCRPRPGGEACSAATTTTTTAGASTTSTTLPVSCTVNMDAGCPDSTSQCGASFAGGRGCRFEAKGGCYDSGSRAYKVRNADPLTITLSDGIVGLEVFFAGEGAAVGTMTFRDAGGAVVGAPLMTNGNCLAGMPARREVSFPTPVRTIDVTAAGGVVWVDSFRVNP